MIANRQQWCGISGWTSREFDRNLTLGFPAQKKTGSRADSWLIDTREAIAWVVAQAVGEQGDGAGPLDERMQRARLLRAQANLAELTEQERRGALLPAEEVIEGWQSMLARARSLLLGLPAAAAEEAVSLARRHRDDQAAEEAVSLARRHRDDQAAVQAVREMLTDGVYAALTELARAEPDDDDEQDAAA